MRFSVFPTKAAKSQIHAFILHINLVLLFYLREKNVYQLQKLAFAEYAFVDFYNLLSINR